MVTTSNCCCIFSLRTGTLIIGWVCTVNAIIQIAANITVRASKEQSSLEPTADGSWGSIVKSFILLLVAGGLLYGAYTDHRQTVLWYVILQSVMVVVEIIWVIVLLIYAAVNNVAIVISFSIITWLIQIYLIIVVYSFYKELNGGA